MESLLEDPAGWFWGIIFFIFSLIALIFSYYVIGIILLCLSVIIFPISNKMLNKKLNLNIPDNVKSVIIFVAITIIIFYFIFGSSNYKETRLETDYKIEDNQVIENNRAKEFSIGDDIQVGDLRWKIKNFTKSDQIGKEFMNSFIGKKADGVFIILDIEVENVGKSAKYISDSFVTLVDEQGREFSSDSGIVFYLQSDGSAIISGQINPGIIKQGKIIYDVPEGVILTDVKISSNLLDNSFSNIKLLL